METPSSQASLTPSSATLRLGAMFALAGERLATESCDGACAVGLLIVTQARAAIAAVPESDLAEVYATANNALAEVNRVVQAKKHLPPDRVPSRLRRAYEADLQEFYWEASRRFARCGRHSSALMAHESALMVLRFGA